MVITEQSQFDRKGEPMKTHHCCSYLLVLAGSRSLRAEAVVAKRAAKRKPPKNRIRRPHTARRSEWQSATSRPRPRFTRMRPSSIRQEHRDLHRPCKSERSALQSAVGQADGLHSARAKTRAGESDRGRQCRRGARSTGSKWRTRPPARSGVPKVPPTSLPTGDVELHRDSARSTGSEYPRRHQSRNGHDH